MLGPRAGVAMVEEDVDDETYAPSQAGSGQGLVWETWTASADSSSSTGF